MVTTDAKKAEQVLIGESLGRRNQKQHQKYRAHRGSPKPRDQHQLRDALPHAKLIACPSSQFCLELAAGRSLRAYARPRPNQNMDAEELRRIIPAKYDVFYPYGLTYAHCSVRRGFTSHSTRLNLRTYPAAFPL